MERKVCIITGANAGIGREAADQIASLVGYHVILVCRNAERGAAAKDEILKNHPKCSLDLQIVDMGLRASIQEFAEYVNSNYEKIDVLIHNAAIFNVTQKSRNVTSEGLETVWATNHLGPVLMTELLIEKLKKSDDARIITISSKGLLAKPFLKVDLRDPEYARKKFNIVSDYYQSKLAQEIYTNWLAERFKESSISSNCIRVTAVQIDVNRHPELSSFMKWVYSIKAKQSITPARMAETYTFLATSSAVKGISGQFFDENNEVVKVSKYVSDFKTIKGVMDLTKQFVLELRGL